MTADLVWLLARAFALGFVIAMPVGPISLLILRRTVAAGPSVGVATALGAASADTIYGACAAFGLSAVTAFLQGEAVILGIAGGLMLIWLGVGGLRAASHRREGGVIVSAMAGGGATLATVAPAYGSALVLTLTNPLTILSYAAAFAGIGLAAAGGLASALATTAGLALGSTAWQLFIVAAAGRARRWMTGRILALIDRLSGAILIGFGLWSLYQALAA